MTGVLADFFVPIRPKPSNQRRAAVVGGHARVVQDPAVRDHQNAIAAIAAAVRPKDSRGYPRVIEEPVHIDLLVVLPRPASLSARSSRTGLPLKDPARRWARSRPDLDNLQKSVLDGLRSWWTDDSLVVAITAAKVIAALGEAPGYRVRVTAASVLSSFFAVLDDSVVGGGELL